MKYNLYSIRDTKVGFMLPAADPNDSVAVRNFSTAVHRSVDDGDLRVYDLELYLVGSFDIDSGKVFALDVPDFIVSAQSIIDGFKEVKTDEV